MSGISKLLSKIGDVFSHLFDGAKRTWNNLEPKVQEAMVTASKYVDIINTNIQEAPDFVIDLLKKQFPNLPIEKITEIALTVSKDLHIAVDENSPDLVVLITNLQKHLSEVKPADGGKTWAKISHTAYLAIAVLLAPASTKISVLISLAEYVYHDLIKGGKS